MKRIFIFLNSQKTKKENNMKERIVKKLYGMEKFMVLFSIVFIVLGIVIFRSWIISPQKPDSLLLILEGAYLIFGGALILAWIILVLVYKQEYLRYRKVRTRFKQLQKTRARRLRIQQLLSKKRKQREKKSLKRR